MNSIAFLEGYMEKTAAKVSARTGQVLYDRGERLFRALNRLDDIGQTKIDKWEDAMIPKSFGTDLFGMESPMGRWDLEHAVSPSSAKYNLQSRIAEAMEGTPSWKRFYEGGDDLLRALDPSTKGKEKFTSEALAKILSDVRKKTKEINNKIIPAKKKGIPSSFLAGYRS